MKNKVWLIIGASRGFGRIWTEGTSPNSPELFHRLWSIEFHAGLYSDQ